MMTIFCCAIFLAAGFDFAWASYKKRDNFKRPFYLSLALIWFCVVASYIDKSDADNYMEMVNWGLILITVMCSEMDFRVKRRG
jgi:hypothetical protein